MEEERESGFPTRETTVQEPDARDDEPDNKSTKDEISIMVFEADVLCIYVRCEGVAARGDGGVEYWLLSVSEL